MPVINGRLYRPLHTASVGLGSRWPPLKTQRQGTRLNVNGGSIALGHPIGCTGTRITVTLVHEMQHRKAKRGLATLYVSGGMGMALESV